MKNIEKLENRLWAAADDLRANSKLTSTEYCMPVLGLIFLRHAYNRYLVAEKDITKNLPSRVGQTRPITKEDFSKKNALFLREKSQYDHLLNLPGDADKGKAIIEAMEAIEKDYESLAGILPKDYQIFDNDLLSRLLKIFNDEALRAGKGDVFGRIYEYFLMKFAMQGAQDSGEFFTPVSLVQTIVNVIEPDHGTVFDPACGSGGMFVQTSHFLEEQGKETQKAVTFFGQEKTATTIRLAKMNLAVHGLEGKIVEGNTFYEDHHELRNKCDFVMANPPFNVDGVDADKIKGDPRLPYGLPGVNQKGSVSNGNYLWISYFHSYLNDKGRAGFVMSSQASSAGHGEKKVRQKLVESGDVDIMISIRANFFYTRSVPCELWFLNKAKPEEYKDKVLMIDARNIYRQVTRRVYDFSPEQLSNLSAIVWLYRGNIEKYLNLIQGYFESLCREAKEVPVEVKQFDEKLRSILGEKSLPKNESSEELKAALPAYEADQAKLLSGLENFLKLVSASLPETNGAQFDASEIYNPLSEKSKGLIKQIDLLYKLAMRSFDSNGKSNGSNGDLKTLKKTLKDLEEVRKNAVEKLKSANYFYKNIHWLQSRFPKAKLQDVEGLVKLVDKTEIKKNDWSLTPGRYVGVAPQIEENDFQFEERIQSIHKEILILNDESAQLAEVINKNYQDLF